ncbi:MAG: TrkA family potassium uptake protein [Chloroflexi bacterium]|nr:TrkA family potassium uptake protein [Chloroflexota bacterium]
MPRRQVVVIGLGRFGSNVAKTLYKMGHDVLAIDNDDRVVQEMMGQVTYPVKADATSEATLRELGVPNFDVAVVAIGSNIQASIMATVLMKSLGVPYILGRARNDLHGQTLERVGAHRVVYPEQEMGVGVARNLFNPDVLEYMELGPSFGVSKVKLPDKLHQLTMREAGLAGARDKYGLAVIAIRRGKELILLPSEEERLRQGDLLVVAARDELLEKLHGE